MTDDDAVNDLLSRWDELRAQGAEPTAEELCAATPELLGPVREGIEKLKLAEAIRDLPPPAATPPAVAGYEILGEVGRGGMGVVYKARQLRLNRVVALKVILTREYASPDQKARFRREAEAVARLRHPNIVEIHELGEHDGQPFVALEYLAGGPLAANLKGQPQPPRRAAELVETLARAARAAHEAGIVHRDLKPGNVLLAADGTPKIADFGLAKQLDAGQSLTESGAIVGTPSYMAPEQAGGKKAGQAITPLTDVYALGATLYELLTGRPPFQGLDPVETLLQVVAQEPVPPRRLQPKVPRDLETVCLKCLEKEPRKRYASATALADDLCRFRNGEPIQARRVNGFERAWRWCRRKPRVAILLAAVLLASLGALAGAVWAVQERFRADGEKAARLTAELAKEAETARRREEEGKRRQSEAAEWERRAAVASAEQFSQKAALYYAKALEKFDTPETRARWLESLQRSLVPVATSSRRVFTNTLTYSPDGRLLVSGDVLDGRIRVWRTDTWGQTRVLSADAAPAGPFRELTIREIVFRLDRPNEIVAVGPDGLLQLWDLDTGKRRERYPAEGVNPDAPLRNIAVEPPSGPGGGRRIVTGDEKGTLTWWDLDRLHAPGKKVAAHPGVRRVRYRPDGGQCASTGDDGVIRLWDPEGRSIGTLALPDRRTDQARLLAAAAVGGAPAQGPLAPLPFLHLKPADLARPPAMYGLAYSPDGRHLAVGSADGHIYVWDAASRQLLHTLQGHEAVGGGPRWVLTLAYASAERLFSGGVDGTVREWDTRTGRQVALHGHHDTNAGGIPQIYTLALRPDGREVATCGADMTIRIWQAQTGKLLARLEGGPVLPSEETGFPLGASAFCAGGDLLVTSNGEADAFLRSWDTRTLRERRAYAGLPEVSGRYSHNRVSTLAIHPDAGRFVSAEPNGDLVWWETARAKPVARSKAAHTPLEPRRLTALARAWGLDVKQIDKGAYSWRAVTALAWSRDGKRVASAGVDGTFKLWDAQDHRLLRAWKEEEPGTLLPAFPGAPGEPKESGEVKVARFFTSLSAVQYEVRRPTLLFDPAGGRLIAAGGDGVIRVWQLGTGTPRVVDRLEGHARRVNAAALSADGKLLASGSEDGVVLIWDLEKRKIVLQTALKPLRTPDSVRPAGGTGEHEFALVVEPTLKEQYGGVRSLEFSPDRRWLAVVLHDGSVSLMDALTGEVPYRGVGHDMDARGRSVITAYFTREGELLTVGGDGTVRHWDLPAWAIGRQAFSSVLSNLALARSWDPNGCLVLASGAVMRWSPRTGRLEMERDRTEPTALLYDPTAALAAGRADGKAVLATERGEVLVLDVTTGKTVAEFKGPDGQRSLPALRKATLRSTPPPIEAVAVQPGGALAASAWKDGSVDLWRLKDGGHVRTLEGGRGRVVGLAFRPPDGRQLAVAYFYGELCLWDLESGKPPFPGLRGPSNARGLCYSPDGKRLIQGGADRLIAVWNPETGRRERLLEGHLPVPAGGGNWLANVWGAAYSPDGKWLATGGADATVRLWDAQTLRPLAVLSVATIKSRSGRTSDPGPTPPAAGGMHPGVRGWVKDLTFTADGGQLVAVQVDGEVRVYDLKPIAAKLKQPPETLLEETEAETGLRLRGDRLVPVQQIRLARPGETFRPAYRQHPSAFHDRLTRATALQQEQRYTEERDRLERLLADPGVPELWEETARTNLAVVYLILGKLDEAEAQLRTVLRRNPNNALARVSRGALLVQQWRFAEAAAHFRKLLKEPGLLPDAEKYARWHLCNTLARQGKLEEAEVELDTLVRGTAGKKGPVAEATIRLVPLLRATILQRRRRFVEAAELLQQLPNVSGPLRAFARLGLPGIYAEQGQLDKAQEELDEFSANEKTLPEVVAFQAALDARRGKNLEQGGKIIRKLLEEQPDHPDFRATLGWILARRGKPNEALAVLEKLSGTVLARDPVFLDRLGDVYSQARRPQEARAAWRRALELFPKSTLPDDLRKRGVERKLSGGK